MTKRRITVASFSLLALAAIVVGTALAMGLLIPNSTAEAQEISLRNRDGNGNGVSVEDRIIQAGAVLRSSNPDSEAAGAAVDLLSEIALSGLRPLPTEGPDLELTEAAAQKVREREQKVIGILQEYIGSRKAGAHAGTALFVKQLIEEQSRIAMVLGDITRECGVGDFVLTDGTDGNGGVGTPNGATTAVTNSNGDGVDNFPNACSQLQPLMNVLSGEENEAVFDSANPGLFDGTLGPGGSIALQPIGPLAASYTINLRADIIPPRWSRDIPEHVEVTGPLAPGECSTVFKEFRGLLLQLHLERITSVRDPGNQTGTAGSSGEPIWNLQWMPAQYGKQWNMCNTGDTDDPEITTKVTRQIVEDDGLIYFWRWYD